MLQKFFFISILVSSSLILSTHSYNSQCVEHQKSLLLQLKNELIFDSSRSTKLVQWNRTNNDCCKWFGVECDAAGNVVSLQLDDEAISGGIGDTSSLFGLVHLQKLNLAYNNMGSTLIPKGIHKLTSLTHLNLSYSGFVGQIPIEVSSLRRLVSLDISNDDYANEPFKLESPTMEMLLSNMTRLRELYLDGVSITSSYERMKWSHIISSYLPNITSLSLSSCSLSGPLSASFWQLRSLSVLRLDHNDLSTVVPDLFAGFPSLATLSLVECGLNGSFPNKIFRIPTLQNLDLSRNALLNGSIPPFEFHNGSLNSIVVSSTNFSGLIPSSLSNLKSLSKIDLSKCRFTGTIPPAFANLTRLTYVDLSANLFAGSLPSTLFECLSSLVYLNLDSNSFSGSIPHSVFGLPSLVELHLGNNKFSGLVADFPIVNVSNIASLHLSGNRLEGPVPDFFFRLLSLESLELDRNSFNGTFQLDKLQSLTNLIYLYLSNNRLSIHVNGSSTFGLPRLKELHLASCNLHDFPNFLKRSDNIEQLDLSHNKIAGEVPSWVWGAQVEDVDLSFNLLTGIRKPHEIRATPNFLDFRSNQLRGPLHHLLAPNLITPNLEYLLLSNNSLTGSIPALICSGSAPFLSALDLSVNKLSGHIPPCLLESHMLLSVLDLGRNNFTGYIPDIFPPHSVLQYLDLNNNSLGGKMPESLRNCKWLEFLNVGNNMINDTFPCMLSSSLRVLVLHSNRFHGEVRPCHSNWPNLQILDISWNDFDGGLESINFSSWKAMTLGSEEHVKQSSGPGYYSARWFGTTSGVELTMKGVDMHLVRVWPQFNAIDLSSNNFGGEIPAGAIGELTSLYHLNFSHNAINGSIPKSFGQLRNLESLDLSQNRLSGAIPTELARLTFLSFLNLSYNELVGEIPNGRQLQTFSTDSFVGNPGLCGFNVNISCTRPDFSPPPGYDKAEEEEKEIEWAYVCAAAGYVVGLGSFVWLLVFCRSFRYKYFGKIDDVVAEMFDAIDRRRRRRRRSRRARAARDVRNGARRQ